jgi:hypothetical protein
MPSQLLRPALPKTVEVATDSIVRFGDAVSDIFIDAELKKQGDVCVICFEGVSPASPAPGNSDCLSAQLALSAARPWHGQKALCMPSVMLHRSRSKLLLQWTLFLCCNRELCSGSLQTRGLACCPTAGILS